MAAFWVAHGKLFLVVGSRWRVLARTHKHRVLFARHITFYETDTKWSVSECVILFAQSSTLSVRKNISLK